MKNAAKAKQIVEAGFNQEDVFAFFDATNKDVMDYIAIFGSFGVDANKVWNAYEDWQEA
jgi:hypothetical protein